MLPPSLGVSSSRTISRREGPATDRLETMKRYFVSKVRWLTSQVSSSTINSVADPAAIR